MNQTIDLRKLSNEEIQRAVAEAFDFIAEANKELQQYKVVRCTMCGFDDIAFRGEELPFITWTKPSGHPLCPQCSIRFKNDLPKELTISPVDEIMALLD